MPTAPPRAGFLPHRARSAVELRICLLGQSGAAPGLRTVVGQGGVRQPLELDDRERGPAIPLERGDALILRRDDLRVRLRPACCCHDSPRPSTPGIVRLEETWGARIKSTPHL